MPPMKAGIHHTFLESPNSARAGYATVSQVRKIMTRIESGATIFRTGMPNQLMFAGEARYRSGRRSGKTKAATPTITTHTTPARTPSASHVAKSVETTLHASIRVTRPMTRRIAGTGEWVRSLTCENRSGSSRSNDQAKTVRIGMKVLPTIAGRLQKRKEPTIRMVRIGTLYTSDAMKWYQGPVGILYAALAAVLTATMKS